MQIRYTQSPVETESMNTNQLRSNFLIDRIFEPNTVHLVYTHYDRYIAGGIHPVDRSVQLETYEGLKAPFFLARRELGIINVGGPGTVLAGGTSYTLDYKEALYVGKGTKEVIFSSNDPANPAKFYLNSAPAHRTLPTKKVTKAEAGVLQLGSLKTSNERAVNQLLVQSVVETCQLQMGITELREGSVWNTMPAHVHDRRMEVYFYFELPEDQAVCHFMGRPQATRHIWLANEQAVISPPWSIHAGAGTSNYAFIWGMAGENLDYSDMEVCQIKDLR